VSVVPLTTSVFPPIDFATCEEHQAVVSVASMVKVKQSRYRPRVAQRVPGS